MKSPLQNEQIKELIKAVQALKLVKDMPQCSNNAKKGEKMRRGRNDDKNDEQPTSSQLQQTFTSTIIPLQPQRGFQPPSSRFTPVRSCL